MTWTALPLLLLMAPSQDQIVIADQRIERSDRAQEAVPTPTLDAPDPQTAATQTPIIVERDRDDEPDHVILGSRIPRGSIYSDGNVATSTGIAGLTPDSGLNPFRGTARVAQRITTTCVSDDTAVGVRAACLLLEGQNSYEGGDYIGAADIYRYLLGSDEFNPNERLEGGRRLMAVSLATDDVALREEALLRLLDSELLDSAQQGGVRRNLVDLALRRRAIDLAFARLEAHVAVEPDDAQSLANLAIMRRTYGREDAVAAMQQAIAAREATGGDIPQGWRDLAAGLPYNPEPTEVVELP